MKRFYWFCRITDGTFGEPEYFQGLVDNVNDMTKSNDWFLLANDFASYMDAQAEVDRVSHRLLPLRSIATHGSDHIKCWSEALLLSW